MELSFSVCSIGRCFVLHFKAAIFDMDGTLVDSLMFWDILWKALGEKYLGDPSFCPSKADDKKVRTATLKAAMELIHTNYHLGESGEELLSFTNRMLHEFYSEHVALKPGVREFLEYCAADGVKMCIASATAPDLVAEAMEHCGLTKYFSKVFSCSDLGKGKEHPDVFLLAAAYLGETPADTWVFEDSLVAIETVTKVGMPTVGIYDRNNFGQEQIEKLVKVYIAPGETLCKLIG